MRIDLIVYDFDGVMTNNKVLVREDGKESVLCSRDDGWAVWKIKDLGITQMILSGETNPIVRVRALKLAIPCNQGCLDKKSWLVSFCTENDLDLKDVLYVGNGLNDLEVMKLVGHPIAPADSHQEVKNIVGVYVTRKKGGEGVLMEVLSYIQENML